MIRQLRVLEGPDKGKVFEMPASGAVVLGRATDTFTRLTDRSASRYHCRLEVNGARVLLTNSSEFGTLVNDRPITQHELRDMDVIRLGKIGETRLVFEPVDIHAGATICGKGDVQGVFVEEVKGLLGKTLAHFQIGKLLAEGSSGTVFRARDTKQNRDVALKIFLPDPKKLGALSQSFQMLQPVLGLDHPNLVTLYEAGSTEGYFWLAMEYVEGDNLQKQLEQSGLTGMIEWQHVLRFGIHLANGLDALHRRQVIHRNITPGNVLVTRGDRQAKLGGLWRARAVRDCLAETADTQAVLRSVAYMPPERLRDGQPGTARGDIYGLGAVLYHLLAGRPPFGGLNDPEIINRIIQTEPTALREFQLSLPQPLESAVLRMLAKTPADRYPSASELLTALQGIAAGATGAPAPRPAERRVGGKQEVVAGSGPTAPAPAATAAVAPAPLPSPPAGEGNIVVACQCGQALRARSPFAGTRVRCPCCGGFIDLPGMPSFVQPPQSLNSPASLFAERRRLPAPAWKTAATPPASPRLLREALRYFVLLALLAGTLLVSLSGVVCDHTPQSPSSDKPKPEAVPKQPAERRVPQPPQ